MGWTNFPTSPQAYFYTGQLIAAADMNTYIRDNLSYLLSGFPLASLIREGTSDYSLTNTTFADVDGTNLILTMTLASTRAIVIATFLASPVTNQVADFDIIANSATRCGGTNGVAHTVGNGLNLIQVTTRFTGLTPGVNTFKLQAKSRAAGTYTIYNNTKTIVMLGWGY